MINNCPHIQQYIDENKRKQEKERNDAVEDIATSLFAMIILESEKHTTWESREPIE